ncbi:outer membrane protein assembly factor BamB family protein [Streptomyces sp. OZ13]|uniref:outer membrane protein assembly factor BamB family protein n=1 Tax=Streptomyces sp. OZ13 TaxID=3452210 RepID=UPI003F8CDC11
MPDDRPPLTISAGGGSGRWTLRAPGGTLSSPVVVGDTVHVVVSDSRIGAVDAHEGRIRWCSDELTKPDGGGILRAGGTVVVPVNRDYERSGFVALDAETGEVRWKRRRSRLRQAAAAGSAVVLWNDEDGGQISGVDASTGETLWEDEFSKIYGLLVRGGTVIIDTAGFRALDARTGDELWQNGYGDLLGQGEEADAALFHTWRRGELCVRATDTGEVLSRTSFPKRVVKDLGPPPALVDGGRALFSEALGRRIRLFAWSGRDGATPLIGVRLGLRRFTSFSQPAVCVGDRVYATTWRDRLYVAEAGGRRGLRRLRLTAPDGRAVHPEEIAAGHRHLFVRDGDAVGAVRDGRLLWAAASGVWERPVPLGADRVLFLASSRDGTGGLLHCADAETGRRG